MQQDVWELRLSLGNVSWKVQTSWCNLKQTGQCFFKYHLYSLTATQSSRKWLWFSLKLLCRSSVLWLTLLSTSHHGKKNWSDQQHGSWNQRDSEPAEESKSLSALSVVDAVSYIQQQSSRDEVTSLQKCQPVKGSCRIYKLDPILQNRSLRVGGRLNKLAMPEDTKHPDNSTVRKITSDCILCRRWYGTAMKQKMDFFFFLTL